MEMISWWLCDEAPQGALSLHSALLLKFSVVVEIKKKLK